MTLFISTYQLKNNIDQKEFTMEKRKGCNPVHADITNHLPTRASMPNWSGIHRKKNEVKGRRG